MITALVVIFLICAIFGGFGMRAGWAPYYSGGPLGLLILVVVVLALMGRL
jgi:hypothetical protein